MLLIEFVENRHLDLCRAIVEQRIKHLAATRHFYAHRGEHAREPLQSARRFEPGQRLGRKATHLVAPRIEQMTAEKKPQCEFFLRQVALQVPRDRKSTRLNSSP